MRIVVLVCLLVLLAGTFDGQAETRVETFFDNTDHRLTVYYINGKEPGATMMIIGGIQGDEPGGYIAADLYADMILEKGNLIVVPRANFLSIIKNMRGINGDMNRKFATNSSHDSDYEYRIVEILKTLMSQSDVLLNLHEGSGFYYPEYVSDIKNPMRYGQSIIVDALRYVTEDGKAVDIYEPVSRVIDEINNNIRIDDHRFHLNNHDTLSEATQHKEQRGSATYNALTLFGIPAYGIETSKSITSIETKVKYQTLAINAFMREYDIIPQQPSVYLPTPDLNHLVIVTAGNTNPFAVKNGSTLSIPSGTSITVTSVVANYNRGISVDIIGFGSSNDIDREAVIQSPTKIAVYKDAYKCGEVNIDTYVSSGDSPRPHVHSSNLEYFKLRVNDKNVVVSSPDTLHIVRGDVLRILDAKMTDSSDRDFKINFRGFVGNTSFNDAEDRGYDINTATDLIERFSTDEKGCVYTIEAIKSNETAGVVFVSIAEPEIEYIIVEDIKKNRFALTPGDSLMYSEPSTVKILSIISNITGEPGIDVFVTGSDGLTSVCEIPAELIIPASSRVFFRRTSVDLGSIAFAIDSSGRSQ